MKPFFNSLTFLVACGLAGGQALAQQNNSSPLTLSYDNTPLREVLTDIEASYQVKFSYLSDYIEGYRVSGSFSESNLEKLLQKILGDTDLNYQFIDGQNIILSSKNPTKIQKKKENYSLKGMISHSTTKQPVAFASIVINDIGKGAVSDLNGRFEITNIPISTAKLMVYMVGFKKVERTLDLESVPSIEIELEEAFVELEGIEITPGTFNIQTAEPRAHQLSKEEITFSPNFARDIYRTLSLVPGVSNTEFSSKARIRGGHSDETAIYLDNFEIYEPFHLEEFDGVFSVINTDFVEETKVLTGGFSPRYTDKISGIISVKTPDNIAQTETKISLDIINASIMRKQKISDRSSAFFGARRGYVDFLLGQVDNDDDKLGIEPIFYDVWGKYNYHLNKKHHLTYNFMYSQDNFTMREQAILREDFFNSRRKALYNWVNWKWLPSDTFYSITTLGYQMLDKNSDFSFESSISDDNIDNRNSKIFIINQNSIWDFHPDHSLEFGLELKQFMSNYRYREDRTNRTNSTSGNIVIDRFDLDTSFDGLTLAGYLQESYKVTPKLTLMGGLRLSGQSYGESVTFGPRTALGYDITERLKLNLAYGIYYQPDNFQKTRSYIGQTRPFSESSRSDHYTGSLSYIHGNTNILLNAYYKDNKRLYDDFRLDFFNRIAGVSIVDIPFNTISGSSRGFEITSRHQLKERHLLSLTYRYGKDKIRNIDGIETFRDFDRRHSVTLNNVFKFKGNFTISTLWTYHTGQPFTPAEVEVAGETSIGSDSRIFYNIDEKNTGRLPTYHSLNFKIDKSWILKKVEINAYLNVVNFYNRGNVRNFAFDSESNNNNGVETVTVFRDRIEYFTRFITPGISIKF